MQRHRSITTLFLTFGTLLLAVSLTQFCLAQNAPPASQIFRVSVVRVKPEMDAEYREFVKNETLAAYKKGGGTFLQTGMGTTLGEATVYVSFTPSKT